MPPEVRRHDSVIPAAADDLAVLLTQLQALQMAMSSSASMDTSADVQQPAKILRAASSLTFMKDAQGRYQYVNESWSKTFGHSEQEWRHHSDSEMWPAETAAVIQQNDLQARRAQSPVQTVETIPVNGEPRRWLVTRFPIPSPARTDTYIGGVALEILQGDPDQSTVIRSATTGVEGLESDRATLLERIAQNEPLDKVLQETCLFLQRHLAGAPAVTLVVHATDPLLNLEQTYSAMGQPSATLVPGSEAVTIPIYSGSSEKLGSFYLRPGADAQLTANDRALLRTATHLAALAIEHQQLCSKLERQANFDTLTGLPNRSLLRNRLEAALAIAAETNQKLALLWIDLDRFKELNDILGHGPADALLQAVAGRLVAAVDPSGTLARPGGDEFAVLLSGIESIDQAVGSASEIIDAFLNPFHMEDRELFVTASIGISLYPDDGRDAESLLRCADIAMYYAKANGRNRHHCYDPKINNNGGHKLELETSLRHAIERGEFQLYYQPQADIRGNMLGVEALLRWNHPKLGLMLPGYFISIAEESGLMTSIGSWVLEEACRQTAAWRKAGLPKLKVAVNVSPLQLYTADFVEIVRHALESAKLDPESLEVELTESAVMHNFEKAACQMDCIRKLGVAVAVDDFGTGYSSLSYLQRLPIDTLKIDQSFIRNAATVTSIAVLKAIAVLGQSLGLKVVAEGVEKTEQLEILRQIGVDVIQGYLIGRPVPADATALLMRRTDSLSS